MSHSMPSWLKPAPEAVHRFRKTTPVLPRLDGNNVAVDQELSALSQNALMQQNGDSIAAGENQHDESGDYGKELKRWAGIFSIVGIR